MAWINVINEEKATGSLKDQYNNLIEPWGGVDNILFLIYESNDPFSKKNLDKNRQLLESLETIDGVESVTSLTNLELFTEGGDYLLQPVYEEIPYEVLLKIFWDNHNPTTPNRQGPDIGTQYRSVIFFHTPEQEKDALEMKTKLASVAREKFNAEIVTEIKPAEKFYRAEEYHQQYFAKSNL